MHFKTHALDLNNPAYFYIPNVGRTPEELLGPVFKEYFYAWLEDDIDIYPIILSKLLYQDSSLGTIKALDYIFSSWAATEKLTLQQFQSQHNNSKVLMLLNIDPKFMVGWGVSIVLLPDPPKKIIISGSY